MSETKPFAEVQPEEAAKIVTEDKTVFLDVRYVADLCHLKFRIDQTRFF